MSGFFHKNHYGFDLNRCCRIYQYFIPSYGGIILHCMDIHLLINSSVDEHSGCFHFLTLWIMMIWTCMYMYLFENIFSILLGCISRNESAEWLGKSRVIILRNHQTLSTVSKQFYISTSNIQGFQFLHILANSCICCHFLIIITILIGMKGYLTVVLTWLSLIINVVECAFNDLFIKKLMIFLCLLVILHIFLGKISIQVFCHF